MVLSGNLLFNDKNLFDVFQGQLKSIKNEVDKILKEKFIANSDDEIVNYIFSTMEIIPLKLINERIERSDLREIKIKQRGSFDQEFDMPCVELEFSIPFVGNAHLWKFQPSSFTISPPRGKVTHSRASDLNGTLQLCLRYSQNDFKGETVNNDIERNLNSIEKYLSTIKSDIAKHNKELLQQIRLRVVARRGRLNAMFNEVKTIRVPLKKRVNAPDLTSLPIRQRKIPTLAEKPESEKSYEISAQIYQEILTLIRHQGATYERTPKTYHVHDEEELRDIMLGQLNGQFEGQATGETFRKKGKTDICIEVENRAAFVAECKVWYGEQQVLEAIDQLLSYLTWRDVKTSLVIFNKSVAGFKGIQEKLPEILKTHPNFISIESVKGDVEWRVRLRSEDDNERFIGVHVFLFNLFVKQSK